MSLHSFDIVFLLSGNGSNEVIDELVRAINGSKQDLTNNFMFNCGPLFFETHVELINNVIHSQGIKNMV